MLDSFAEHYLSKEKNGEGGPKRGGENKGDLREREKCYLAHFFPLGGTPPPSK